jgi:hypothetical protein
MVQGCGHVADARLAHLAQKFHGQVHILGASPLQLKTMSFQTRLQILGQRKDTIGQFESDKESRGLFHRLRFIGSGLSVQAIDTLAGETASIK